MFDDGTRIFTILPHGNSTSKSSKSFKRTQESATESIKNRLIFEDPRKALDHIAEEVGGILTCQSFGSLPRNAPRSYYLKSKIPVAINIKIRVWFHHQIHMHYLYWNERNRVKILNLLSTESWMCARTGHIFNEEKQLKDIEKFWTNEMKFGVFQIDPSFNWGEFSVTTTQYEHLLLVNRISGQPPVMVGPIMTHQKKERVRYMAFANFIASLKRKLRSIRAFGTDSESNLYNTFLDEYPIAHHLLCFIHFKNSIKDHLYKIGVDSANMRVILIDLFAGQISTRFKEGILDAVKEVNFEERLGSLRDIWEYRLSRKEWELYNWFLKYKEEKIKKCMMKSVLDAIKEVLA